MKNLEEKGEKNTAVMLRERIVACESCEILATKELKTMKTKDIKKLLGLEQIRKIFQHFPPAVNLKLVHQWFMNEILAPAMESINSGDQLQMQSGFKMLVDVLALKPLKDDMMDMENSKIFNPKAPSFNGLFQDFIIEINEKLRKIQEGMRSEADFSIDNAKLRDQEAEALKKALKPLMSFGEDWWFPKHGLTDQII